jgi:hypothetical protein
MSILLLLTAWPAMSADRACPEPAAGWARPLRDDDPEQLQGNVGSLRLFPTETGFDLAWIHVVPATRTFASYHVSLDADGQEVGPWTRLSEAPTRALATNGPTFLHATGGLSAPYQVTLQLWRRTEGGTLVAASDPDRVPHGEGESHDGTVLLGWNPRDDEWAVLHQVWTDHRIEVHVGRADARGRWIDGSRRRLSTPGTSATLSSHTGASLHWTGDGFRVLWSESDATGSTLVLGLVSPAGEVQDRTVVDTGRSVGEAVLAFDGIGYGVAYTRASTDQPYAHVRFAHVLPDREPVGVSLAQDGEFASSMPSLTWDGSRFTVAWTAQLEQPQSRVFTARLLRGPGAPRIDRIQVDGDDGGQHDQGNALVFDGCRHALGYTRRTNSPNGWIAFLE